MKEMTSEEIDRALKLVDRWQPQYGPMDDVDPQTEMEAAVASA